MNHRTTFALILGLLSVFPSAVAQAPDEAGQRPMVQVDVTVQMEAIERSLGEIQQTVERMAGAMEEIAATGELSDEQKTHLDSIMSNLDHVMKVTSRSVDALPTAVQRSRESLRTGADELVSDIKLWFFIMAGVVAIVLVVVLLAFYRFTLKPLQTTVLKAVGLISEMAQAMANTSRSLEVINETHREVLKLSGVEVKPPTDAG